MSRLRCFNAPDCPQKAIRVYDDSPFDLAALVAAQTERWFVTESLRTARLLRLALVTGLERIEPADLSLLGRMFNAELKPR